MSEKESIEWRNVMHGCKNVVHRVFFHPITWDACCSRFEEKVPLFSLQPLSSRRSVEGKQ
jgi:hypothetical protein